jgi:zinc transport system ATP-binding protein
MESSTSSTEPVIAVRGATFSYGGEPALLDVNLSVSQREALCVVGPNGGGKTTLIKLILGLLTPQRGEVLVFGRPPRQTRSRIGYMPQHVHFDPLFPVTVMDIVLMGRLGRGVTGWAGRADRRVAAEALALAGLAKFGPRPFASLSGGERQRVLIARALCSNPDLLLLDEPTSNVDSLAEARLLDLLRELNQRMTILMVSHDLGFVSGLVQNVVCVNRRVVVHPTSQLTGEAINDIYGAEVRAVRHHELLSRQRDHD